MRAVAGQLAGTEVSSAELSRAPVLVYSHWIGRLSALRSEYYTAQRAHNRSTHAAVETVASAVRGDAELDGDQLAGGSERAHGIGRRHDADAGTWRGRRLVIGPTTKARTRAAGMVGLVEVIGPDIASSGRLDNASEDECESNELHDRKRVGETQRE